MKTIMMSLAVFGFVFLLASCGGSSTTPAEIDSERLFTGTLDAEASATIAKAAEAESGCIGEVCAIVAYNADGTQASGEVEPAENRYRVRVRAGNWMFGFEDGAGNRLGYLAMNGITALTVEEGGDVDVGRTRLRNGQAANEEDAVDMGNEGIYSYYGQDMDRDGIPAPFDSDDPALEPDLFDVLFLRPHDGQLHVAPCRPIKIVFTEPIDDASVSEDTIKVLLDDDTPVSGEFSVWEDAEYGEYEIGFAPTDGYPMGAAIEVTVLSGATGVLSEDGEELTEDVKTSFEVRDFGGTSQTCHDPDLDRQRARAQEREREREGNGGENVQGQS